LERATALCAQLGHELHEPRLPIDAEALTEQFARIWAVGCAQGVLAIGRLVGQVAEQHLLEPLTWELFQRGRALSAPEFLLSLAALQQASRAIALMFSDLDVLLTPTLAQPTPPLGVFAADRDDKMAGFHRAVAFAPFTPLANISGQPAMSVPMGADSEGLPLGVHFMARFGDEATLFGLAAQLEQAAPWDRAPPAYR
jgi:amidase